MKWLRLFVVLLLLWSGALVWVVWPRTRGKPPHWVAPIKVLDTPLGPVYSSGELYENPEPAWVKKGIPVSVWKLVERPATSVSKKAVKP
jgi:hypothetical protein